MEKTHPPTWPCRDCEVNIPEPIRFRVSPSTSELKRIAGGEAIDLDPLCYNCWVKRNFPA